MAVFESTLIQPHSVEMQKLPIQLSKEDDTAFPLILAIITAHAPVVPIIEPKSGVQVLELLSEALLEEDDGVMRIEWQSRMKTRAGSRGEGVALTTAAPGRNADPD